MKKIICSFILFLLSFVVFAQKAIVPETALQHYLLNGDTTIGWEVKEEYQQGNTKAYSLLLISQQWQGMLWKHEMVIFVPETIEYDGALLFITGGSVRDGIPQFKSKQDGMFFHMAALADKNKALTVLLYQVPNQPLYNGLVEDALISYTLNEFRKDGNYSWPLLFPMVKSAVKAMDAVQEFSKNKLRHTINRFIVSGASKRGWTAWLTGAAQDNRVVAIAPMVIDMLNMPATLEYQKEIYGGYSDEIQDYVNLEIPQAIRSEFGSAVVKMVDPYSYRDKLIMPKMIFFGTNDPYWTIDAVKHYINGIPGHNLLHYVPNAGHGLGDQKQAFGALGAFLALNLTKTALPVCAWSLKENKKNIRLEVKASPDKIKRALLWTSTSDTRDFRNATWASREIKLKKDNASSINVTLNYPKTHFQAFYVDLVYPDPNGDEYSVSTRTFVADGKRVFVE